MSPVLIGGGPALILWTDFPRSFGREVVPRSARSSRRCRAGRRSAGSDATVSIGEADKGGARDEDHPERRSVRPLHPALQAGHHGERRRRAHHLEFLQEVDLPRYEKHEGELADSPHIRLAADGGIGRQDARRVRGRRSLALGDVSRRPHGRHHPRCGRGLLRRGPGRAQGRCCAGWSVAS
jgi:hypothetical protein